MKASFRSPIVGRTIFSIFVSITFLFLFEAKAIAQRSDLGKDLISSEKNSADGTYRSLAFSETTRWDTTQANELFAKYLGIDGQENTMRLSHSTRTKNGTVVSRYVQYYKGIKVELSSASLLSKDGRVRFISSNYLEINKALPTAPAISEPVALEKALAKVGASTYMWQEEVRVSEGSLYPMGELVWIEDLSTGSSDRQMHLAYAFNIYASQPLSRNMVYVDANTGHILFMNPLLHHTLSNGASLYSGTVDFHSRLSDSTYKLTDTTRGRGINTYSCANTKNTTKVAITSPNTTFTSDPVSLDAHWGASKVYDYWLNEQGRNSIDDAKMAIFSYTHYDVGYNNAFWDGSSMVYGDGTGQAAGGFSPLVSLDVCAHEIGHGICQHTAGLIYEKETGAMNEGFSDIWGAVIEHYADPHETDTMSKDMWKIGEEIGKNPLRSMQNPNLRGQPDTYKGANWVSVTNCTPSDKNDQCGVHTNSGVLNHWFYLLCMGGSGTNDIGKSFAVTGVGIDKGADIAYQTELLLSAGAVYNDCRTASIEAAIALYGACSAEEKAVTRAWYAVGVGKNFNDTIDISGNLQVCAGASTDLYATGNGAWVSENTAAATVDATGKVAGAVAGTATISYSVGLGCAGGKVVTVTTSPADIAGSSTVHTGSSITLTNAVAGGKWKSSKTSIATVDSLSGVVGGMTEGVVVITYSIGSCRATKAVTVAPVEIVYDEDISIYPNPTNGSFTVTAIDAGMLSLYSLDGRRIIQYKIGTGKTQVTLPRELARGIYMCRYNGDSGGLLVLKLVTE